MRRRVLENSMPEELPVGFDAELQSQLESKLGYDWADQLALKWGTDWSVPCGTEMEQSLGFEWESQSADTKSETLLKLISEVPGYDEQAWLAYVAQNGRQWDGTEATWDQFTEWFAYYANAGGFAVPADALLKYLASQSAAERTTTLWPASDLPPEGPEGPEEPEEPEELEASDEDIETIMRELLEDNPELADVEEEIRRELVIEAINETLAKEEGRS
jgi:hypothetical protein